MKTSRTKHIIYVLIIALTSTAMIQGYRMIKQLKLSGASFTTDQLGQLYLLRPNQTIEKYDKDNRLLISNNFRGFGPLASLDVSNPMELYAFYKEQNVLLFLDNQLGVRGQLNLNNTGSNAISCVARSYDNGLWVFDQQDLQLKKYDKRLQLELQSGNIRSLTGSSIDPIYMEEDGTHVMLLDTLVGLVVFDIYANYSFIMPGRWNSVQSFGQEIYLSGGGKLERLKPRDIHPESIPVPKHHQMSMTRIQKDRLWIQHGDSLSLYAY